MSCNGCRVLRKGCSDHCVLRTCLHWIPTPKGQGNATLFLARFFGRSDLLSLIAAIPEPQRPALFRSLLFEACGRTVNPVNGAVGLLATGNWQACQAAVDTVLSGGVLQPIQGNLGSASPDDELSISTCRSQAVSCQRHPLSSVASQVDPNSYTLSLNLATVCSRKRQGKRSHFKGSWTGKAAVLSLACEASDVATVSSCGGDGQEVKLLNLFF